MTLGNALDNELQLIIDCDACGHSAPVDVAALVDRRGRDFPVPDMATHGRGGISGERQAWVRVSCYKPPVTN